MYLFLVRPGSWGVDTCDYSIVLPYDILALMLFGITTEAIFGVASFARWMFAPQSEIACVHFLGEVGGVSIILIKLILGLLILILLIISPNLH